MQLFFEIILSAKFIAEVINMLKIEKPKNTNTQDITKLIVISPKKDITTRKVLPKQINSDKQEIKINTQSTTELLFKIY
jgi:hypothetical protein